MAKNRFSIRNIFKQLDTRNQMTSHTMTRMESMYAAGPEHELQALLNSCSVKASIPMPRQWVKLSRLLYAKISIYKDAIDKTADFVGNIELSEGSEMSPKTRAMVVRFWDEISVFGETETKVASVRGMNSLVNEIVKMCLRDGLAFSEDRFREMGGEITDEYIGSMLFDSDNFDYATFGNGSEMILRYLDNQYPQVDFDTGESLDNQFFHVLKLETDPRSPWGLPLAAGDEMLAKTVISLLISVELQAKRFGNPPTFTTVTPKDLAALGNQDFKIGGVSMSPQDALILAVKNFKAGAEGAWALAHRGRAAEVIQAFPAPVDIVSRVLGEGMTNMVDPELLWKLCILLINGFGVPPALMGINATSGGMNSDMFSTSIQVFRSRISKIRERVAPIIRQITINYLLSEGVSPVEAEKINIEFEDVDLQGPKERAEVAEIKARTKKLEIENYEILSNYDEEAAKQYAVERGIISGN